MKKRSRMKPNASKRLFTKTAKKVHRKNGFSAPMRGGIRL